MSEHPVLRASAHGASLLFSRSASNRTRFVYSSALQPSVRAPVVAFEKGALDGKPHLSLGERDIPLSVPWDQPANVLDQTL